MLGVGRLKSPSNVEGVTVICFDRENRQNRQKCPPPVSNTPGFEGCLQQPQAMSGAALLWCCSLIYELSTVGRCAALVTRRRCDSPTGVFPVSRKGKGDGQACPNRSPALVAAMQCRKAPCMCCLRSSDCETGRSIALSAAPLPAKAGHVTICHDPSSEGSQVAAQSSPEKPPDAAPLSLEPNHIAL